MLPRFIVTNVEGNQYTVLDIEDGIENTVDDVFMDTFPHKDYEISGRVQGYNGKYIFNKSSLAKLKELTDTGILSSELSKHVVVVEFGITTFETDCYDEYDVHSKVYQTIYYMFRCKDKASVKKIIDTCNRTYRSGRVSDLGYKRGNNPYTLLQNSIAWTGKTYGAKVSKVQPRDLYSTDVLVYHYDFRPYLDGR